ncbi:MAG: pitrilysin family protein, partial [Candidatus Omnitrophica bacterium]|nr:pitrilysin family protein [Candidatus Omnitrophota bacterium]
MYKKTKLKNGLKVITNRMPGMQSAAVGIWIKTGGRFENDEYKGIAHYLEHLLFKGSKKYSCRQIKETIEGVGGALNGFTSEELTCYLVKTPARHIDLAVDVLSDMVLNPLLDPEEVNKERTVILEELKMYKDQPQSYMYELLDELLWPKQPLGQPIIGTVESINRIKPIDLAGFQKKYYCPSNIVVSSAGLVDHDKLVSSLGKIFPKNGLQAQTGYLGAKEEQLKPQQNIFHKDTEQAHLAIGFHAFKRE